MIRNPSSHFLHWYMRTVYNILFTCNNIYLTWQKSTLFYENCRTVNTLQSLWVGMLTHSKGTRRILVNPKMRYMKFKVMLTRQELHIFVFWDSKKVLFLIFLLHKLLNTLIPITIMYSVIFLWKPIIKKQNTHWKSLFLLFKTFCVTYSCSKSSVLFFGSIISNLPLMPFW